MRPSLRWRAPAGYLEHRRIAAAEANQGGAAYFERVDDLEKRGFLDATAG